MSRLHMPPYLSLVVGTLRAEHARELGLLLALVLEVTPQRELALVQALAGVALELGRYSASAHVHVPPMQQKRRDAPGRHEGRSRRRHARSCKVTRSVGVLRVRSVWNWQKRVKATFNV